MPSDSVDLVYLDPPFKSNQDYNMLYTERDGSHSAAQQKAFSDTWKWDPKAAKSYRQIVEAGGSVADMMDAFRRILASDGRTKQQSRAEMLAYLSMMAPRLVELHRVLKPEGAIYLHCDPTASHYLKLLLDAVFGPERFRNEIVWKRSHAHNGAKRFAAVHDVILFFARGSAQTWNPTYEPLPQKTIDDWYNNVDGSGRRFNRADLTAAGTRTGSSGATWRGIDVRRKGRHWAIPGFVRPVIGGIDTLDALDALDRAGRLHWPKREGGMPMLKRYLNEARGAAAQDVIVDIAQLHNRASERVHYPTQKPTALLKRFIEASTNEGDTVLDPFCGCGSTIEAAEELRRRWVGIDITHLAIDVIEQRLAKRGLKEARDYVVDSRYAPATLPDIEALARKNKHAFQGWALQQAGVEPFQLKPGPDRGIDARKMFFDPPGSNERREIIVSVKGGNLPATCVRDLIGTVQRERAQIGVLITLKPPTKHMLRDAAEAPAYRGADGRIYSGIQILTVKDLLEGHTLEYPLQLAVANATPMVPPTTAPRSFELESRPIARKMAKASLPLGFNAEQTSRQLRK